MVLFTYQYTPSRKEHTYVDKTRLVFIVDPYVPTYFNQLAKNRFAYTFNIILKDKFSYNILWHFEIKPWSLLKNQLHSNFILKYL